MASLDVAKAFDSVRHHAVLDTLRDSMPKAFVDYMDTVYRSSKTVFEVSPETSHAITVLRQGSQAGRLPVHSPICHGC